MKRRVDRSLADPGRTQCRSRVGPEPMGKFRVSKESELSTFNFCCFRARGSISESISAYLSQYTDVGGTKNFRGGPSISEYR